jgi:hypothetical protein
MFQRHRAGLDVSQRFQEPLRVAGNERLGLPVFRALLAQVHLAVADDARAIDQLPALRTDALGKEMKNLPRKPMRRVILVNRVANWTIQIARRSDGHDRQKNLLMMRRTRSATNGQPFADTSVFTVFGGRCGAMKDKQSKYHSTELATNTSCAPCSGQNLSNQTASSRNTIFASTDRLQTRHKLFVIEK